MIPCYIKYTDDMPTWMGGYAKWFYIAIRPKYRDDKGIHAHEIEHVKQWWITSIVACSLLALWIWYAGEQYPYWFALAGLAMFDLLYSTFQRVKLQLEVWAYKAQLKHYPDDRTAMFAKFIASKYGLESVTAERAERLLRDGLTSEARMR